MQIFTLKLSYKLMILVLAVWCTANLIAIWWLKKTEPKNSQIISFVSFEDVKESTPSIEIPSDNSESPKSLTLSKGVLFDFSDDLKALGYTGQTKLASDSKGNHYIAYRKKYEGEFEIFVTSFTTDLNNKAVLKTSKKPISIVGENPQRVPSIAVGADNKVHVVWYGEDSDEKLGRQVKYSVSKDLGVSWSKWVNIAVVSGYDGEDYWQEHPQIMEASNKDLYVVWEGKDSKNEEQQTKITKSTDGGKSWSKWKNIKETPQNTQSRPHLIEDSNGALHVFMYSSYKNKSQQIWHSISSDLGTTWSDWENISKASGDSRHADAVFGDGNIMVVWRYFEEGKPSQIRFLKYDMTNKVWSEPANVNNSNQNQFFPSLSVTQNNSFFVAWIESSKSWDLPREDPESGETFIAKFNQASKGFDPKHPISESNSIYPHLESGNFVLDKIYIIYSEPKKEGVDLKLTVLTEK